MANAKTKKDVVKTETGSEEIVEMAAPAKVETVSVVGCDKLRVRENPTTTATVKCLVDKNQALTVLRRLGAWVQVKTEDGTEGFVVAQFVK